MEHFYNPDLNPVISVGHGVYRAGDSVWAFPNWERYPRAKVSIVETTEKT